MNRHEAVAAYAAEKSLLESQGAVFENARMYIPDGWKQDFNLAMDQGFAMDAQPALSTTPNMGIPFFLSTLIDPNVYEVLFSPLEAASILPEVKEGDWTLSTVMFPTAEHAGEVSNYDDYSNSGVVTTNVAFPSRQPTLYQTMMQYGDRELAIAGLAKINWVSQLNASAAWALNRYQNQTYFFGVKGLQNYGILNDPNLTASLTPGPKAFGNNTWITNGIVTATPNEIFLDIQALVLQLILQSGGNIKQDSKFVLALSPLSKGAITAVNAFDVNVNDLLEAVPEHEDRRCDPVSGSDDCQPAGRRWRQLHAAHLHGDPWPEERLLRIRREDARSSADRRYVELEAEAEWRFAWHRLASAMGCLLHVGDLKR